MVESKQSKISLIDSNDSNVKNTYGRFVWEPLPRGHGITLGNSLRRILMSSLPGAAVTSINIEGILHEFSTVVGVREDVTDIVLNIKSLRLRIDSKEPCKIKIDYKGQGIIKASDIICPPEVSILNPELYIASLEKEGELKITMNVQTGIGYVSAEKNKNSSVSIGEIYVDSIFTPIIRVNYDISDTRVGNVTNFDKLTLDIWTDGSITPSYALGKTAGIFIEYMQQVTNLAGIEVVHENIGNFNQVSRLDNDHQLIPIDDVEFSVRAKNCLARTGVKYLHEISNLTEMELNNIKNAGKKTIDEIKAKLISSGMSLRTTTKGGIL